MRSDVAAASTGARSTPPLTATPVAVAPLYLRKSRRDRLIVTLLAGSGEDRRVWNLQMSEDWRPAVAGRDRLPFGARVLVPHPAHHDDAPGSSGRSFQPHDVTGVQGAQIVTGGLVADDDRQRVTGEIGTDVGGTLDPQVPCALVIGHDNVTVLLERVGEALRHARILLSKMARRLAAS